MCFQDRSSSMTTTRDEIAKNHGIQDICPSRLSPDIYPCCDLDLILITTSVHQPGACLSSQLPPCLFFQALAFLIPYIHLDAEDISSPCPNETLLFIRMCSLIDVCFSILTSIIPPRCIVFFTFHCVSSHHCIVFFLVRYLC